ncbi:MAG: amidohydrolase [Tepidanaerobacteraceae bacterium]|nr:amidohydrolase [Tepidanaerobacteraceae bacterium]
MRRHFHQNPELSWEEYKTTDKIQKELEDMGIKVQRFDKTGLVGELKGNRGSKTVMLRADIDALPIKENTGLPFKAKENMHACGHDCHAAMLLGAAKILSEIKDDINGNVKLLFQAAEETCFGAKYYVEQGVLDDIAAIFGMHVWGNVDAPAINIESGPRMASCDNFRITVKGEAAHGSAPHQGKDAIIAAASIIMNLQTFVSRINNPLNPLVITIGTIHGGNRFNILSDKVVMEGTTRTFSPELRKKIEGTMRNIIEHSAEALCEKAELEYFYYPGPLINDKVVTEIAQKSAEKLFGRDIFTPVEKVTGSEDFAFYQEKVPGAYAFLGCLNKDIGAIYPNHSDKFIVDESILRNGAALYAQFAIDFLNQ